MSFVLQKRRVTNRSNENVSNKKKEELKKNQGDISNALNLERRLNCKSKVFYDHRDFQNEEKIINPFLTLMDEVLLIGLKDKEGYLSFWNDKISYTLRGCILIELVLRNKISLVNDANRYQYQLRDRLVEVIDSLNTGEVLLDESLKIMNNKNGNFSVNTWLDLLSGEDWKITKFDYQLKQVRERIAKGLVEKGILRNDKKSFFLFDMATHPIIDVNYKNEIKNRILFFLSENIINPDEICSDYFPSDITYKFLRSITLICCAYSADVLANLFISLSYEMKNKLYLKSDEILKSFSKFPFKIFSKNCSGTFSNLKDVVESEINFLSIGSLRLELIAAVFSVFIKVDSII